MNNPLKRNAFNLDLVKDLGAFFRAANDDSDIRCVILRSASPAVFTSGLDLALLKSIAAGSHKYERIRELQREFGAVFEFKKPVIAAVSGFCIGAGIDLIAMCDLRYATESASFSAKEIAFGIAPDVGTIPRFSSLASEDWALEKLLTGDEFNGKEAMQRAFVTRVFTTDDEMMAFARTMAAKIANQKPGAVELIKNENRRLQSISEPLERLAKYNVALLFSCWVRSCNPQ